jgi:hypothetical protein
MIGATGRAALAAAERPVMALSGRANRALINLRFEGKIGHDAGVTRCLLMTRSPNTDPVLGDLNARSFELAVLQSGQLGDSRCDPAAI